MSTESAKKALLRKAVGKHVNDGKGGVMSALRKGADKINKLTGAEKLVDYASGKIAKRMVSPEARKYVKDDVKGKDALKSAGEVALNVAAVASPVGVGRAMAKSAAKKAVAKAAVKNAAGVQGIHAGKASKVLSVMGSKSNTANEIIKAAKGAGKKLVSKSLIPPRKLKVTSDTVKVSPMLKTGVKSAGDKVVKLNPWTKPPVTPQVTKLKAPSAVSKSAKAVSKAVSGKAKAAGKAVGKKASGAVNSIKAKLAAKRGLKPIDEISKVVLKKR